MTTIQFSGDTYDGMHVEGTWQDGKLLSSEGIRSAKLEILQMELDLAATRQGRRKSVMRDPYWFMDQMNRIFFRLDITCTPELNFDPEAKPDDD